MEELQNFLDKTKKWLIILIVAIFLVALVFACSDINSHPYAANHNDGKCDNCGRPATTKINGWEYCASDAAGFYEYHFENQK